MGASGAPAPRPRSLPGWTVAASSGLGFVSLIGVIFMLLGPGSRTAATQLLFCIPMAVGILTIFLARRTPRARSKSLAWILGAIPLGSPVMSILVALLSPV